MGMPLEYIRPGESWKVDGYFWNWETRGYNALPGDHWERTYSPEQYNDGSSSDAEVEESKAGLPPGYSKHAYFYQSHHPVVWRCMCTEAPPSAYLSQSFTQCMIYYRDPEKYKYEKMGLPMDFIVATHGMSYAPNRNLPQVSVQYPEYSEEKTVVKVLCVTYNKGRDLPTAVRRSMLNITQIPSPSTRCFTAEMMESYGIIYNSSHSKLLFPAGGPLNNIGNVNFNGMPGYAAAGQGKENYERYGDKFTAGNWGPDAKVVEENRRQIQEGRHGGYVLHTFFDGSAKSIPAAAVGRRQLKPGKKIESVTAGPYGLILAPDTE